jgi:hypothetical protein
LYKHSYADDAEESGAESAGEEDKDDTDTYSKKKKKKRGSKTAAGATASAASRATTPIATKRSANIDKLLTVFPLSCKVTFQVGGKNECPLYALVCDSEPSTYSLLS